MKRLLIALLCVAFLMTLGCGKKEAPAAPAGPAVPEPGQAGGDLTLFSWWTAGGEAEGLADIVALYKQKYPAVNVINAAVAGGAGTNAKAVLKTRMMGGDPPDTFQVHGGSELLDTWVDPGKMEPITDLYQHDALIGKFPAGLVELVGQGREMYAVPANVHRGNVLWTNAAVFKRFGMMPPDSFESFFLAAERMKKAGVTPLAVASRNKWEVAHLFEDVLLGTAGASLYRDLFAGKIAWTDDHVVAALENLAKMMAFANPDHAALTWDQACGLVMGGKAAMTIMGDWAKGYFTTNNWVPDKNFGAIPSPGTAGAFVVVTDTFGLPKGAKNPQATRAFLSVLASVDGQVAFNLRKGSIPARTGVPMDRFDAIAKKTMTDFAADTLVPSCVHGSAASELFVTSFNDEVALFLEKKDAKATAAALEAAAKDAGLRQ
jgi:glucose/mannose transport system substrate-binding protein